MMNRKSQAAVTDLFIAIAIFIALITITTTTWDLYNSRLASRITYDDMVIKSFQISDIMFKTSGEPNNWETIVSTDKAAIKYVGLVENEKFITYQKMTGLLNFTTDELKKMFHSGQYDIGIRMRNATGSPIFQMGAFGGKAKHTVNLARTMLYKSPTSNITQVVNIELALSKSE